MLDIRNKKSSNKSFLERFQFVLKCPSIRFDTSLGENELLVLICLFS